jgi:hypothetical protein
VNSSKTEETVLPAVMRYDAGEVHGDAKIDP